MSPSAALRDFSPRTFATAVLAWYAHSGRKTLPWQLDKTPYSVWISEIMLQQTQVATVIPYFQKFMQRFPDVHTLAAAPVDDVLALWSGLGYYSRARHLHACAQQLVQEFNGEFPDTVEQVCTLKGIGRSTAGAILSLSRNTRAAIFDGNVKRVLCRVLGVHWFDNPRQNEKDFWALAEQLVPANAADYNQAMMDLGATLCTRSKPECDRCPLQTICVATRTQDFEAYPGKKPKKTLPVRQSCFLIAIDNNTVLLQQRPPSGIWGGLWTLPEIDTELSPQESAAELGLVVGAVRRQTGFRHTFSHFHLDISAYACRLSPAALPLSGIMPTGAYAPTVNGGISPAPRVNDRPRRWQPLCELDALGLPAPIRRLLDEAAELIQGPTQKPPVARPL